jgi:enoyl-CoA hydratase/carnithine racemase
MGRGSGDLRRDGPRAGPASGPDGDPDEQAGGIWDSGVVVLDPDAALAALRTDPEAYGPLAGAPLLVVRVDGPPGEGGAAGRGGAAWSPAARTAAEVAALARHLPCVSVALCEDPAVVPPGIADVGFDILLTAAGDPPRPWVGRPGGVGGALRRLAAVAGAAPLASVALVQLLRLSEPLDVRDAVVAESFVYSQLQAGPEFAGWLARRPARPGPPAATVTGQPPVLVDRDGPILRVTLNRPHVRNAVDLATRDALVEAFRLAAADSTVSEIRLAGAGPSFCSGGDLAEFGTAPDPARAHAVRTSRSIPLAVIAAAARVTAYVHGGCVGAGVELSAFAGRVVAAPDTTFRLPEVEMGLVPGAGGTASVPRRVGRERAAFLALSGLPLAASEAAAWGLVDEIATPGRPHG